MIAGAMLVPAFLVQSTLVATAAEDLGAWQGEVALSAAPAVVTASSPSTTLTAERTPALSKHHRTASVGIYDRAGTLGSCSTAT